MLFSVFDLLLRLSLILITPFIDYHDSLFSRLSKEKKQNGNTRNGHSNHKPVSFYSFDDCVMCNLGDDEVQGCDPSTQTEMMRQLALLRGSS